MSEQTTIVRPEVGGSESHVELREALASMSDQAVAQLLEDVLEDRRSGRLIKAPRSTLVDEMQLVQTLDWCVQRHLNIVAAKIYQGRHPKHWLWPEHKRFFLERVQPGMRVLDIGCGASAYLQWMAEAGADVTAIDIDEPKVERARSIMSHPRLRFEVRDAMAWQPEERFDVVICSHVIEHLVGPVALLSALRRCAPRLLVGVPRIDSRWQKLMYRDLGLAWKDDEDHEREYTPELLTEQITDAGWRLVEMDVGIDLKAEAVA